MGKNSPPSSPPEPRRHTYRLIVKQKGVVISDVSEPCSCPQGSDHTDTLGS